LVEKISKLHGKGEHIPRK